MATLSFRSVLDEQTIAIPALIAAAQELAELPLKSLRQQPAAGRWSVLQCFEHMTLANALYNERIAAALNADFPKANGRSSYQPGMFGQLMVKSVAPRTNGTISMPIKTFKRFEARPSEELDTSIIELFIDQQETLLNLVKHSQQADLGSIRITSAVSLLRFKLGDCYRFLTAHNQRHLQQARNALKVVRAPAP